MAMHMDDHPQSNPITEWCCLVRTGTVVLNSKFYQDTSGNILNEICKHTIGSTGCACRSVIWACRRQAGLSIHIHITERTQTKRSMRSDRRWRTQSVRTAECHAQPCMATLHAPPEAPCTFTSL